MRHLDGQTALAAEDVEEGGRAALWEEGSDEWAAIEPVKSTLRKIPTCCLFPASFKEGSGWEDGSAAPGLVSHAGWRSDPSTHVECNCSSK